MNNYKQYIAAIGAAVVIAGVTYQLSQPMAPMRVLLDGGIQSDCEAVALQCPVRLNQRTLNRAIAAGLQPRHPKQRYVRAQTLAFSCPSDGGMTLGGVVPVQGKTLVVPLMRDVLPDGGDRPGEPAFDITDTSQCDIGTCGAWCATTFPMRLAQSPCVRRPSDGGVCRRPREAPIGGVADGGLRMGELGEVWQSSLGFQGAGCERTECSIVLGDDPEVDL